MRGSLRIYGMTLLGVALATGIKYGLDQTIGLHSRFLLFLGVVMMAAWFGGTRAGWAAMLLSVGASFVFLDPPWVSGVAEALGVTLFVIEGAVVIALTATLRSSAGRLAAGAAEANEWKSRYEAAAHATGQMVYERYAETNEVRWGGEVERICGTTAAELGNDLSGWLALLHPEDRPRFESEARRIARARSSAQLEYRIVRKDGSIVFVEDRAGFFRDVRGDLVRMVGVVEDVTERHRQNEVLERFRTMSENATEAHFLIDRGGRFRYANRAAARSLGYDVEALSRLTVQDVDPSHDEERFRQAFARTVAGDLPILERIYRRRDGSTFPVEVSVSPVIVEGERCLFAAVRDVSDRKRAAEAIENQQRWLEAAVDRLPAPLLFIEPGTARILFANRAAHELAGGRFPMADDVVSYPDLYHVTEPSTGRRLRESEFPGVRVALGERLDALELDWHVPKGKTPILLWGDMLPEMHGRPATALLLFQDVTRLREVEAALRHANVAKDEFLAMLGHELRNPLAAVRNALAAAQLDDSQRERALEIALRQTGRLVRLVDDLLDVARIMRGAIRLRKEPVRLSEVLERAVEASRSLVEERGHVLSVSFPADPFEVEADPARLEQVIDNLLSNAAKYTSPGGRIELTGERQGETAIIRVRDTGRGIPADVLPHVFDLFAQAERTPDRAEGGLGVGLTIVRRLVELHGGTVEARSEGRGSEFVVRLPARPAKNGGSALPTLGEGATGGSARILVVEDNRDAAESLGMLLEILGHEVRVVADGGSAIEVMRQTPFDVALIDIGLPGVDGYEVVRRLRALPDRADALLVALTGYGREEDRRKALEAGFDRHLTKPADPDALGAVIASRKNAPEIQ